MHSFRYIRPWTCGTPQWISINRSLSLRTRRSALHLLVNRRSRLKGEGLSWQRKGRNYSSLFSPLFLASYGRLLALFYWVYMLGLYAGFICSGLLHTPDLPGILYICNYAFHNWEKVITWRISLLNRSNSWTLIVGEVTRSDEGPEGSTIRERRSRLKGEEEKGYFIRGKRSITPRKKMQLKGVKVGASI